MFLRRFTDFVLQNRVQAMAMVFVLAFIPIIGSISILIAALVTLRKGAKEGAYVVVAATVPYVMSYYASSPASQDVVAWGMLGAMIIGNLLTWALAIVLRHFSSWNVTLESAGLFGVIVIILIHLIYPDIQSWWAEQIKTYFANTTDMLAKLGPSGERRMLPTESQLQIIATAKRYATGFVVASCLFNALLQLVIARWWQAVMFNPGGLRRELYQIRLSHLSGAIFLVSLFVAYLGNELALDMMPVLYTLFFIAGLSLLHCSLNVLKNSWLWLVIAYAVIIFLFPLSFVLVAIVALLDTGINFRKKFNFIKR